MKGFSFVRLSNVMMQYSRIDNGFSRNILHTDIHIPIFTYTTHTAVGT